jgi:hypothetical protein
MADARSSIAWLAALAACALAFLIWIVLEPRPESASARQPEAPAVSEARVQAMLDSASPPTADEDRSAVATADAPLRLRLLAWPAGRPVPSCAVEVRLDGVSSTHQIGDDGRLELARPRTAQTLWVGAAGFRPGTVESGDLHSLVELDVTLRPLQGLFGRVVDRDGTPRANVEVTATQARFEVLSAHVSGAGAKASTRRSNRSLASDLTDELGWYALDVPADLENGSCEIRAFQDLEHFAQRSVELPHGDGIMEDLVLESVPRVEVRVVNEAGDGIPGIRFHPWLPRAIATSSGQQIVWRTDSDGRCRVPFLTYAGMLWPAGEGCFPLECRIDGVTVEGDARLQNASQRLEWVCRLVDSVTIVFRDVFNGKNVAQDSAKLEAYAGADHVASLSWISTSESSGYVFGFFERAGDRAPLSRAPFYDRLELTYRDAPYQSLDPLVLTRAQLPLGGTHTVELHRIDAGHLITGRVLDSDGRPMANVVVRVAGVRPGVDRRLSLATEGSDSDGRFAIRWLPRTPGESVLIYVQERYLFHGPIDPNRAQELELRAAQQFQLPYVVEGDELDENLMLRFGPADLGPEGRVYSSRVQTRIDGNGVRRGTVSVPAGLRVRFMPYRYLGNLDEPACEHAVEFDPAAPRLPVHLSVPRKSKRLIGRVVAHAGQDLDGLIVFAVPTDEKGATYTVRGTLDADGGFRCDVPRDGTWTLMLVAPGEESKGEVLGYLSVEVVGDCGSLVLVAQSDQGD